MIKLVIPGTPVAQARVRLFRRGNKTMIYDPQTAIKKAMKYQVMDQLENMDWKKPNYPRIMFWFYMPIPKSMTKKERNLADSGLLKHVKKPDVDNLIKLYLDVLAGIAFDDDNCVSIGYAIKVYSHTPKTVIYIEETESILSPNEIMDGTWTTQ